MTMILADHVPAGAVLIGLSARTKAEVLKALAERAGELGGLPAAAILAALAEREALGSTGVGGGVALPHAALSGLALPVAVVARLARPIDWEAIDEVGVDLVVAVLTPATGAGASLDLLAGFARQLRSPARRDRLRAARDGDALRAELLG
jgi:PTS system nitrogen regulatory IIA component